MGNLDRLVKDVKEARGSFEARLDDLDVAKERYYGAVRRLYERGMPLREIAEAIGVSHQRVHQIVGDQPVRGRVRRAVAKRGRAGGAALLILIATLLLGGSPHSQRQEDALADIREARSFMARELPADAQDFLISGLDEMLDEARR